MKTVVVLLAVVAAAGAPAASARRIHSLDTLQLDGVFAVKWSQVDCPAGTPESTGCWLWAGPGVVPGLGAAEESYLLLLDSSNGSCFRASWQATLTVSGKGEIDAAMQIPGCVGGPSKGDYPTATFTISGGSGSYTGATGSGTLASSVHETGIAVGTATDTWQGALTVPGVSFDTTPPTLTGAANLRVKTRSATGARVSYTLAASDPTDGSLPVSCEPASGSRFRIGRTLVACTATDKDGNTAGARFTVTITRLKNK